MTKAASQGEPHHDTVFDVDLERLAGVYAHAALDAAGDLAGQGALVEELQSLLVDVLDRQPQFEELFRSGLVSEDEKTAMIDRVFSGRGSQTLLSMLKVMAAHGRLGILRPVIKAARELWHVRSGRLRIELTTASPVESSLESELLGSLRALLGAEPEVTRRVNPDLLAGFVVRVGDRVYDASARNRLELARQDMIDRAVEAIHTRPQAFVSP
ncbi:MAG: ATP synthase F1 subunit delta [Pirellulales bacterium]|nr:ATP synthase F1 subunit delta [Pirellulales bacterium]